LQVQPHGEEANLVPFYSGLTDGQVLELATHSVPLLWLYLHEVLPREPRMSCVEGLLEQCLEGLIADVDSFVRLVNLLITDPSAERVLQGLRAILSFIDLHRGLAIKPLQGHLQANSLQVSHLVLTDHEAIFQLVRRVEDILFQ
jgi:hypothetical protein